MIRIIYIQLLAPDVRLQPGDVWCNDDPNVSRTYSVLMQTIPTTDVGCRPCDVTNPLDIDVLMEPDIGWHRKPGWYRPSVMEIVDNFDIAEPQSRERKIEPNL